MRNSFFLSTLGLLAVILASCAPVVTPAVDPNAVMTQAVATVFAGITQTAQFTPPPSETPAPTATVPRTPPAVPGPYQSPLLNPLDAPHTYIQDSCQYLKAKWDANNSAPGTIVMVVMLHGIEKGVEDVADPKNISAKDFRKVMDGLKEQGFEAINTQQLADFLEYNAKIPPRSVVLIQDDRHFAENFNTHFRTYWEQWGWPVVNAWISYPETTQSLWDQNAQLEAEGWVDHQAHGVVHNIPMSGSSTDEYIIGELQGAITASQQHFNKTPIAIIWPGGGFGVRPAQIARQLGYRLGFTINPRGPIMFNWVPLADQGDPQRPYYLPEGAVNDPLMTLPRYWPHQVLSMLDTLRVMGEEAAAYAEQNKATELEYYDIVCAPAYGAIPAAAP